MQNIFWPGWHLILSSVIPVTETDILPNLPLFLTSAILYDTTKISSNLTRFGRHKQTIIVIRAFHQSVTKHCDIYYYKSFYARPAAQILDNRAGKGKRSPNGKDFW